LKENVCESLTFPRARINLNQLYDICSALRQNTSLCELNVSLMPQNSISTSLTMLTIALANHRRLTSFDCSGWHIGDEITALLSLPLRSISLGRCALNDAHVRNLLTILRRKTSVERLDLCDNLYTDDVVPDMVDYLKGERSGAFTSLKFHSYRVRTAGVGVLIDTLPSTRLRRISLRRCNASLIPALLRALEAAALLVDIEILYEAWTCAHFVTVLNALCVNKRLRAVKIERYGQLLHVDETVVSAVCALFNQNRTLQEFALTGVEVVHVK
jgi:hypothetical protein